MEEGCSSNLATSIIDCTSLRLFDTNMQLTTSEQIANIMDLDITIILAKYQKNKCLTNGDRNNLANAIIKHMLYMNNERM